MTPLENTYDGRDCIGNPTELINMNLNNSIYIKLTFEGVTYYYEYKRQEKERVRKLFPHTPDTPIRLLNTNKDGYTKFSLLELMQIFGDQSRTGAGKFFETMEFKMEVSQIQDKDVCDAIKEARDKAKKVL